MNKIIIYSTPTCTYCKMAKEFFAKNNMEYQEFNVATDLVARKEMVEKSQQLGVPVIDIGNKVIVGFDEEALAKELGIGAK